MRRNQPRTAVLSLTGMGGRDEPMRLPWTSSCGLAVIGWDGASESSCAPCAR
jgi:hypothetical protein